MQSLMIENLGVLTEKITLPKRELDYTKQTLYDMSPIPPILLMRCCTMIKNVGLINSKRLKEVKLEAFLL